MSTGSESVTKARCMFKPWASWHTCAANFLGNNRTFVREVNSTARSSGSSMMGLSNARIPENYNNKGHNTHHCIDHLGSIPFAFFAA